VVRGDKVHTIVALLAVSKWDGSIGARNEIYILMLGVAPSGS